MSNFEKFSNHSIQETQHRRDYPQDNRMNSNEMKKKENSDDFPQIYHNNQHNMKFRPYYNQNYKGQKKMEVSSKNMGQNSSTNTYDWSTRTKSMNNNDENSNPGMRQNSYNSEKMSQNYHHNHHHTKSSHNFHKQSRNIFRKQMKDFKKLSIPSPTLYFAKNEEEGGIQKDGQKIIMMRSHPGATDDPAANATTNFDPIHNHNQDKEQESKNVYQDEQEIYQNSLSPPPRSHSVTQDYLSSQQSLESPQQQFQQQQQQLMVDQKEKRTVFQPEENSQISGNIEKPNISQTRWVLKVKSQISKDVKFRQPFSPQFLSQKSSQKNLSDFTHEQPFNLQRSDSTYKGQMLFIGKGLQGETQNQPPLNAVNNIKILNQDQAQQSSPHNTTQFIFDNHANAKRKDQKNNSSIQSDDDDDFYDLFLRGNSLSQLNNGDLSHSITTSKLDEMMRIDSKKAMVDEIPTADLQLKQENTNCYDQNKIKDNNNIFEFFSHQDIQRENSLSMDSQPYTEIINMPQTNKNDKNMEEEAN